MARVSNSAALAVLLAACCLLSCASVADAAAKQKKKAGVTHKVRLGWGGLGRQISQGETSSSWIR